METASGPGQPFWKDKPDFQPFTGKSSKLIESYFRFLGIFVIFFLQIIFVALFFEISPALGWGVLIYFALVYGIAIIMVISRRKKMKQDRQEIDQIQQRAREKTGASIIGSAIHVAGNPNLDRDQKIVIALIPSALVVYPYDHDAPIETIPLSQITAVHTVVYDDERTPHLETVDSTAQALQLTIKYGDGEYDCLLRSMWKVRPIDWYHAIQKARIRALSQGS